MELHLLQNRSCAGWTDFGSYWSKGEKMDAAFSVTDGKGKPVPAQTVIVARWPDGSVKWARHTVNAKQAGKLIQVAPGDSPKASHGLHCRRQEDGWKVEGERVSLIVPGAGNLLAREIALDGRIRVQAVYPVLSIGHVRQEEAGYSTRRVFCPAVIRKAELEEEGALQMVFRMEGIHLEGEQEKMRFLIRMYVHDDGEISFDHTFFFDGDEHHDRLAALGLRFETPLEGAPYQRHVQYMTDGGVYHDVAAQLAFFHRLCPDIDATIADQMAGKPIPRNPGLDAAMTETAHWNHFEMVQDSAEHFVLRKRTHPELCAVDCLHGRRAPGTVAVTGMAGGIALTIRDFWEKYPSGLQVDGLEGEQSACTAWFYAPQAEPFDFSHYAEKSYPACYEGFDYLMPSAVGIAVTCRCTIQMLERLPGEAELRVWNARVRKSPVYVATPEWYHHHQVFGDWSLPRLETEMEQWVEYQLENAFLFYRNEEDARNWYGLFNFGDFMHHYEASRHSWRFDVGGYAWDNTELTPTYWLWLYFLRTGREDVYSLAEALSRHTADVDCYHFGSLMGLGSRHNVRHWGCSCKEPRVSMAGHHRPLYYLGGDRRIGDCMTDALAADAHFAATGQFVQQDGSVIIRSGPDWSSLVSSWMTAYERTLDSRWRQKIEMGIRGIDDAPLKLTSGPEFRYIPETGEMIYIGENEETVNMHLQACMAGTEIWLETAEMLDNECLKNMVSTNGCYFHMTPEERIAASGGLIQKRRFGDVIYSGEMQAYSAMRTRDGNMARDIWRGLLGLLYSPEHPEGFQPVPYGTREDGSLLMEIPWVTTNFTAQWCLKVIVSLAYIGDYLPQTLAELEEMLAKKPIQGVMYGA